MCYLNRTGLQTNAKTKEDYMYRRAQDRIRMYFYKTKQELLKTNDIVLPQKQLQSLLVELKTKLEMNKFHGYYFDRACSANENMKSICDIWGTFTCQGRWDKDRCLYHPAHCINPYVSREARIIFQTWNLDHNKERSRSIIPAIRIALRLFGDRCRNRHSFDDGRGRNLENGKICRPLSCPTESFNGENISPNGNVILSEQDNVKNEIVDQKVATMVDNDKIVAGDEVVASAEHMRLDVAGIYDDLFSIKNLKLVHIVCHDKGAHGTLKAGPYFLLN